MKEGELGPSRRCVTAAWWMLVLPAVLLAAPARAVEPIWGEIPAALGLGTIHPVIQGRYRDAGDAHSSEGRTRMFEQELMLEYAPSTQLNLRLDIPYLNNLHEERLGGAQRSAFVSGLGDITLRASRRFSARQGEGFLAQHALFYGVKLPTGSSDKTLGGGGPRLTPSQQAGTGNPGLLLGYAWSQETLPEMFWSSVTWRRDLGGGFRLGDTVEVTGTYARWLKRPNEAKELGFKIATGVLGQYHGDDTLEGGRDAANTYHLLGIHLTPIATKGNSIFQAGVFVPLVRGGAQDHSDFPYEIRVGFETFF